MVEERPHEVLAAIQEFHVGSRSPTAPSGSG
jgi:hypothetical protein